MSHLVYPKVILYTNFECFGSFVFELRCGQANKQIDRQTDVLKNQPTPTDRVGVGNDINITSHCIRFHFGDHSLFALHIL